ncbi:MULTISPECIES: hypothetical protein [unclassified Streptomyces]|uniref:hypothetical protein n=1 Tax=unclassified Streptomyces TaxID=2593676 RepID=UPI002E11E6BF|nr:hypothetical protein OG573_13485 [Streptomyces sp. NBC_01205]
MTTPAARPRRRWLRIALAALAVVVIGMGATVVYVVRSTPQYRTAFLVDTSDPGPSGAQRDFGALADSVGAAVRNAGDGDALSLRRFGGGCGEPDNTEELVSSATGNGKRIGAAARALTPGGKATLSSGLLAAIDDFSGRYPFRGSKRNRIVVVTTQGTDGCGGDPVAMNEKVRDRMDRLGLHLEFRFVGYRVPVAEKEVLTRLASATRSAAPQFTQDAAELNAVLEKLVVPTLPEAKPIEVPAQEVPVTACTQDAPSEYPLPTVPPEALPSVAPSVRLPNQVKLPAGARVYAARPNNHLIAPAGQTCAYTYFESGANWQLSVSDHPVLMEGYGQGLTVSELSGRATDCSDFGKTSPELLEQLPPDVTESACKEADTGRTVNIPSGVPGLYVGTSREDRSTDVKAMLHLLRFRGAHPTTNGLVCLLPKEQADVCTASLTYFFLQQTAGTDISAADRDRVIAAIEAYVKSLP